MNYDYALKNAFETEQEPKNVQVIQQAKHLNYPSDNNLKVNSSKHLPNLVQESEEPIYSEEEMKELYSRYLGLKGEQMEEKKTTFTKFGKADVLMGKTRLSEFSHLSHLKKNLTSNRFNNYCVNTKGIDSKILHNVSSKQRFTGAQNLYSYKMEGLMGKVQGNTDYIVYPCQNMTLYPNSRQIINVTVKSRVGTTPPEKTEIVAHSRSNFLETKELFFANTLSTVENGCILIDIINLGNSYINLYTSDMLTTACVLESAETDNDMQRVGVITESKGLSDKQLKKAYEEILLQNAEEGDNAQVLQTHEQLDDILDFPMQYKEIVSLDEDPAGICPLHTFKIQLKKDAPQVIHQGQYRQVHRHLQDIDEWVEDGLRKDYLEKSFSIHNIPLVVIPKRKGKPRICLDLRLLNKHILQDRYPLPHMGDILKNLHNMKVFSSIDLLSGFYHVLVDEDSRDYFSFATRKGSYRLKRLPMGLSSSPSIFSKVMEMALSSLIGEAVLIFIDDALIFSKDIASHYEKLSQVFDALRQYNLKIKLSKCRFFQKSVTFLGFRVSEKGISSDPKKLDAIRKLSPPTDVPGVRSILGLFNFFRHMVKDYANIARPINVLLRKKQDFVWLAEQKEAFEKLKEALLLQPCVAFLDYSKKFIISTDASGI